MIRTDLLPLEVLTSARAVVWRAELRDGRQTKVPYQPRRPSCRAAVNDPATWGTFREALAVVAAGKADGPGIVLRGDDGLVGVDLDHCRTGGALTDAAVAIVRALDSYAEVSPSGTGVHMLARGTLPPGRRKTGGVEMYDAGRFLTVTGRHLAGTPHAIQARTAALAALHRQVFGPAAPRHVGAAGVPRPVEVTDVALLDRARRARNGEKFGRLWAGDTSGYTSASEADLALATLLAFWTGGDARRVDSLFRASGLMRPKWDARRGDAPYGEQTIACALAGRR